jgi:hypothetical protein
MDFIIPTGPPKASAKLHSAARCRGALAAIRISYQFTARTTEYGESEETGIGRR